jgi:hypothetical protein
MDAANIGGVLQTELPALQLPRAMGMLIERVLIRGAAIEENISFV